MAKKLRYLIFSLYQGIGSFKHQLLYSVFGFSSRCKHTPTCSRYTQAEIERHGTIVGSIKGLIRLLTCW
ncbi:MAG: membrane protein insertion efficiency factor YidD [Patescibacteria group bacterium]